MSAGPDLTRWNRAGLKRFRYIDGNAVTFLEELRATLVRNFPDPQRPTDPSRSLWQAIEVPVSESDAESRERMARQYEETRTDWAWEIARAFSRACHVLAEHVDAYANEGFLRTATQWDSVRKLVAMFDVYPAPPASASTPLVIEAKDEPGILAAGFAVRHSPKDGGAPVLFETLEELALDPVLNALRLAAWNLSPAPLVELPRQRPFPSIARRPAIVIEGVGSRYSALLDSHAPLGSGVFTVADFHTLEPERVGRAVLRLWEAKAKAEALLDFPWTATELGALARVRLPELRSSSPADLAAATGRERADMERFLEDLRLAEAALDEGVFAETRLAELLSPGAPPPVPPPVWTAPAKSGISAGQVALVVRAEEGTAEGAVVRIDRVEAVTGAISLSTVDHQPAFERWRRGVSSLLARPEVIAVARLAGTPNALTFAEPHGLAAGDAVAWQDGATWSFAAVAAADDLGLLLAGSARPAVGSQVFRAVEVRATRIDPSTEAVFLPLDHRAAAVPGGNGFQLLAAGDRTEERDANGAARVFRVTRAGTDRAVFVPGGIQAAGRVSALAPAAGDGKFRFDGKPGKLASGQWAVGDDGSRLLALRIAGIEELEDHFAVTFESVADPAPAVAGRSVSALMGAGPEITAALAAGGLGTVGALAATALSSGARGVSPVRFLELRAKARLLAGFPFAARDLAPIGERTVLDVLAMSRSALADELKKPDAWTADLLEKLRLLQAVVDEPDLGELRIRDLLAFRAAQPVRGYSLSRLDRLYGVFAHTLRPSGWNRNDTPVAAARLPLELTPTPALARGRRVIVSRLDGSGYAREATIVAIKPAERWLELSPPLAADEGFTLGNLVIHANVVRAGHGEVRPAKVLGSGDAARLSQSFLLKEKGVAFVADPTQPAGVAAAVTVTVAGQTWQQVATLRESRPTDSHYEVRLSEDGFLAFTFGDGRHGRRLPTGTNNVRVSFRVGTGLAGNLAPGRLTKPARPHPRVAAVSQPLAATGGNDREEVASLKAQAPTSVLTLDRAVSLSDFAALAARQASVWQARAFALPTGGGRHASVDLVVVPAGGGALADSLRADLASFLTAHALPGVDLRVSSYEPQPFDLEVEIEVKSAEFDRDQVRKSVETALLDTFSLRRRALGAALFISDIYAVVERTTGVESSLVALAGSRTNRLLPATERQVIFLDPASSLFTVTVREFEL